MMCQLSNALISETETALQQLESVLADVNKKLLSHGVIRKLPETSDTIKRFKKLVEDYQREFKEKISYWLPKIRGKEEKEECLAACIKEHNQSPYNFQMLQEWVNMKEQELEVLQRYMEISRVIDANELRGLQAEVDTRCVVAMVLTTDTQNNELFLAQLEDYFPDRRSGFEQAKKPMESRFVSGNFHKLMLDFHTAMEANKDNEAVKFVTVEEGREDEGTPAVQLRVYEDEELVATDCLLPDPVQHLKVSIV